MTEHDRDSGHSGGELQRRADAALFADPGLPARVDRRADIDERAAQRAERQVAGLFTVSALATLAFIVCYVAFDVDKVLWVPVIGDTSASNFTLGVTLGVSLLSLGLGAIHWARILMSGEETVEERHSAASSPQDRAEAVANFQQGVEGSGIGRRKLIGRSLLGALGVLALPPVILLRDLGPLPKSSLRRTLFTPGMRLVHDVTGTPVKPADLVVGSLVSAVPENLGQVEEEQGTLNERAKSAVVLIRMSPEEIEAQQGEGWDYQGIVCYSKICTHVGCPLGLYEQQTHHMLCPCHQSTFDVADAGKVVFGPAARSLPQLAIAVNSAGELVAKDDFTQPVGPSFWERG